MEKEAENNRLLTVLMYVFISFAVSLLVSCIIYHYCGKNADYISTNIAVGSCYSQDVEKVIGNEISKNNAVYEEKINSLKERLNDFYVVETIIVTLLIAINIGIYIKAAHDVKLRVEEYLEKHIGEIKKDLEEKQNHVTTRKENIDKIYQAIEADYQGYKEFISNSRQQPPTGSQNTNNPTNG